MTTAFVIFDKSCSDCGAPIETRPSSSDSTSFSIPSLLCSDCREMYNNSHQTQIRRSSDDREWDLFHLETQRTTLLSEAVGTRECASATGVGEDLDSPCSIGGFQALSLQHYGLPQQESCNVNEQNEQDQQVPYPLVMSSNSKVPTEASEENNTGDQELNCNVDSEQQSIPCILVLFKREIISRAQLKHVLYIIPDDKFLLVFPRVKQHEAIAHHGTEFPIVWRNGSSVECRLYGPLLITGELKVWYEMACGKNFHITNPSDMAVSLNIAQIQADCEERIAPGSTVKLCMECTCSQDALWEDNVRLTLSTGDRTLQLQFPVACHETNIAGRFSLHASVTRMPDEDREALRRCHIKLMNNIGDVFSLCEHLFQYGILNGDDIEEIKSIRKPSERNADFLRRLPSRGDVLDLLIEIMRGQRENQGAANILQHERCPKK